jgi:diguanylate cyclase (GGDEF)-like protein
LKIQSLFIRFIGVFIAFVLILQAFNYIAISLTPYGMRFLWAPLSVSAILVACVAFYFARYLSDDFKDTIRKLISCARAVEHGEKRDPLILSRKDEFVPLADAINNLMNRDKAIRDANEDPLTGLANRRYIMQRLDTYVDQKVPLAVMFIDLDGFKPINDEYGHDAGDEALKIVAERMTACTRESDIVSRIGGDEFIILFKGLEDEEVLKERADKVLEMVGTPMWIDGNRIRMGASIGISMFPKDATDSEAIVNCADEAMYAAKQGGKNAYRFYS